MGNALQDCKVFLRDARFLSPVFGLLTWHLYATKPQTGEYAIVQTFTLASPIFTRMPKKVKNL